nr:hypothetical protein Iba_chr03bCG3120 [Ipomoea batatas]
MMLAVAGCETTSGCSRRIELLPRSIQAKAAKPHSGSTPRMAWVVLALDRCEKDGEIGELQGDAESVDGHDENAVGMDEWHGIEHPHEAVHQCRMFGNHSRLVGEISRPDWLRQKPVWTGFQTGRRNQSGLVSLHGNQSRLVSLHGNQSGLVLPTSLDLFPGDRFRKSDGLEFVFVLFIF